MCSTPITLTKVDDSERAEGAGLCKTNGVGRTCMVVGAMAESQAMGAIEESFKRKT